MSKRGIDPMTIISLAILIAAGIAYRYFDPTSRRFIVIIVVVAICSLMYSLMRNMRY